MKTQIFGIWGDTNGDDGDHPMIGEAAISTATACFGDSMTGDSGHDGDDVLYIAFNGTDAVPGSSGADWAAGSYEDFESSITTLGNKLLQRIVGGSGSGRISTSASVSTVTSSTKSTSASTATSTSSDTLCEWAGHCAGTSCSTDDDCSGDMVCTAEQCAALV